MAVPIASSTSFLAWYLAQLAANPLRTKAITSGILSATQELSAQKLSGQKKIDKRVIKMGLYGLCVSGPLNHLLFSIMTRAFAGKSPRHAKIGQLLFSNFVTSPLLNSVYITVMTLLAGGRSVKDVLQAIRTGLPAMQRVFWVVSPITLIFAQNYLPQYTWVPFFNIVVFFLGTYMNTLIKRKQLQAKKGE